jgi:quercetin dioxygenase-like cupin family protein
MARKVDWSQIPWEDVNDQVSRKVIMGDRVMMVMYRFQAGLTWPEEIHEGDSYFIESNVPHSTHFVEETILIDIFSPPRKELMEKNRGFAPSATQK